MPWWSSVQKTLLHNPPAISATPCTPSMKPILCRCLPGSAWGLRSGRFPLRFLDYRNPYGLASPADHLSLRFWWGPAVASADWCGMFRVPQAWPFASWVSLYFLPALVSWPAPLFFPQHLVSPGYYGWLRELVLRPCPCWPLEHLP